MTVESVILYLFYFVKASSTSIYSQLTNFYEILLPILTPFYEQSSFIIDQSSFIIDLLTNCHTVETRVP